MAQRRHLLWTPVICVCPASFPFSSIGKCIPCPLGNTVLIFSPFQAPLFSCPSVITGRGNVTLAWLEYIQPAASGIGSKVGVEPQSASHLISVLART